MQAVIRLMGSDVFCRCPGLQPEELRLDGAAARERLEDWSRRYERAVALHQDDQLMLIGRELFDWLDGNGWASA